MGMDKNKLYVGISFVTKIIWEVILVRLEFYLMKLEQELGALSYLVGDLKVPLLVHGVLILTVASLMLGLWVQNEQPMVKTGGGLNGRK